MRTQVQAEFDKVRQDRYKAALASAAGTRAGNVDILAITEGRRRAGSVKVETKVRVSLSLSLSPAPPPSLHSLPSLFSLSPSLSPAGSVTVETKFRLFVHKRENTRLRWR